MAILAFVLSAGIMVYVFLIYPILIILLGSKKDRDIRPRWKELPTVTVILSAHNEEATIAQKLENTLSQEYPEEKLDVLVVDDVSTDKTCEIVGRFKDRRFTLFQQKTRAGKTAALNRAAGAAKGEVLVFTDANAIYQPDAIRQLVNSFDAEGKIGVVCGELNYQQHPQAVCDEESRYWNMEIRLKRAESNLGAMLGANGSIFAMPKELYITLREDLISDFIEPLLLSLQGYRTVYQPRAISTESSTRSLGSEFQRKKRIVQRGLYGLWVHKELLNPFSSKWLALQLWSHKVLRWLTPIWLLVVLVSTWAMSDVLLFRILFYLQIIGYFASFIGIFIQVVGKRPGIFRLPAYIFMLLSASLAGIWGFVRGKKVVIWEPQR